MRNAHLLGRLLITGEIETLTGLRIGDTKDNLTIGGVDLPVIRNRRNNQPYIPGSSLKGKMRSLSEKLTGAPLNFTVNRGDQTGKGRVEIHTAQSEAEYDKYWVNPIFGTTGDAGEWIPAPNRLIVRDIPMLSDPKAEPYREGSVEHFLTLKTDQPFTEVKWEAAIDRVTSAATPRQIERVPAGAVFAPMEMVFNLYLKDDVALLDHLFTAMQILEDDYLGGHGSRGSGKIRFRSLGIILHKGGTYEVIPDQRFQKLALSDLLNSKADLFNWVKTSLALS